VSRENTKEEGYTDHADIGILVDKRAKEVHFVVQVGPPDVTYPLACDALCAVLAPHRAFLQLRAVSKAHARLVAIQPRASTSPADARGGSQRAA
jgi:hypothetical protein